jgi:hypothetical protein
VEPAAEVATAGRGGRVGQRGRYGIDGGFAGLAVFGVIEAGLACTVRRPAVAALAGVGGAVVAGQRRVSCTPLGRVSGRSGRSCWMSWACGVMSTCWMWDAAAARC